MNYMTEVWIDRDGRGAQIPGEWLPVDGMEPTTRDRAVEIAADWERCGYPARIKKQGTP